MYHVRQLKGCFLLFQLWRWYAVKSQQFLNAFAFLHKLPCRCSCVGHAPRKGEENINSLENQFVKWANCVCSSAFPLTLSNAISNQAAWDGCQHSQDIYCLSKLLFCLSFSAAAVDPRFYHTLTLKNKNILYISNYKHKYVDCLMVYKQWHGFVFYRIFNPSFFTFLHLPFTQPNTIWTLCMCF